MLIENIDFNSVKDYLHLERYVNNGSPSGFTEKYTTSPRTSAKGLYENFYLCSIDIQSDILTHDYGSIPSFFHKFGMLIHPDMICDKLFSNFKTINKNALLVAPTASSRTVKVMDKEGWFIKLNYKGLIGRIDRQISKNQALSAIEVSSIITKAIEDGKLPASFFFLREVFGHVIELPNNNGYYDWGVVLREPKAFPNNSKIKFLIPAFSLFSIDVKNPSDDTILTQLIKKQDKDVEDFLLYDIILPLYEGYFKLLINCGLQLECHSQNTLFAIGKNFDIIGFISRDGESIDKDISLMDELNISNNIITKRYKCLFREDYNYNIMHSFMFDFKLGEYLISPIINDAYKNFHFNRKRLIDTIKQYNDDFIKQLPNDFFPENGN